MRIIWGWKIALIYGGFVVLILSLVVASSRQHFDLVSKDYYAQEIAYQDVIDAGKNQAALSAPLNIHANAEQVTISFPDEFRDKILSGKIQFYSPVDSKMDRYFEIDAQGNNMVIKRSLLLNTRYIIKVTYAADGKNYYQESEITLHS
jgi:nitrogen fixation protein FixH